MESQPDETRGSSGKALSEASIISLTFTIAAPSPEHLDGRSPSAYDFSVLFQLGTEANPIVIDDTPFPDPISDVIASNIDGELRSDADTEIMSSPEFWDAFFDERSSLANEAHFASVSVSAEGNPSACSHSEALQDVENPTAFQVDDQGGVAESSCESDHCSGWVDGKHEKGAEHQTGMEPFLFFPSLCHPADKYHHI